MWFFYVFITVLISLGVIKYKVYWSVNLLPGKMEEQRLLKRKEKAISENNKELLISVCTRLGELYMDQEKFVEAINEYKNLVDFHKDKENEIEYACANRVLGEAYLGLQDFETALKHMHIYLNKSRELGNKLEEQRALATLGHTYLSIYLNTGEVPRKDYLNLSYRYLMKSLIICENLKGIDKFEHADMKARLLSNLGVVNDGLENYEKGIELLEKSISICKAHDIYEQLQRSYTSLAALYEKVGQYKNAVKYYTLSSEAAKKLKNKLPLMCSTLLNKAGIYIRMGDFLACKKCLYKAYKMDTSNLEEKELIEHNLRVVVGICRTQKKLLDTPDSDYKTLKALYEYMGDSACALKNFDKAIEYYQKMLQAAENNGENNETIKTCYISLAETYRDNKQYLEALQYYEKEYDMCTDLKDSISTLLKIVECSEANKSTSEIQKIFENGLKRCHEEGNVKEEGRLLSRYITFLQKHCLNSDILKYTGRLTEIGYVSSDTDNDDVDSQNLPSVGENISLSNISDISDNSDIEECGLRHISKRKPKNYSVKRNYKGETALHTACISGNLTVVRHLIEQGHPLNVRDYSGWLPLHEACNHGHEDIVELLLEKGAAVNDRGGVYCDGTTPLHDAAANGHLSVIELLLDKGASVVSKTDGGHIPLQLLQQWYSRNQLADDEKRHYKIVVQRMTEIIKKAGQNVEKLLKEAPVNCDDNDESQQYESTLQKKSPVNTGRLRKYISDDEDDLGPAKPNKKYHSSQQENTDKFYNSRRIEKNKPISDAANEYRQVINGLRHKSLSSIDLEKENIKRPALLDSEEVDDGWLIDDMISNKTNKRRKTSLETYDGPSLTNVRKNSTSGEGACGSSKFSTNKGFHKRNSDSQIDRLQSRRKVLDLSLPSEENSEKTLVTFSSSPSEEIEPVSLDLTAASDNRDCLGDNLIQNIFRRYNSTESTSTSNKTAKRHRQTKLTNFAQIEPVAETDLTNCSPFKSNRQDSTQENELVIHSQNPADPTLFVDIRIEKKLLRVPILASQVNQNTIKWLAEQAAIRYMKKEFIKPIFELETQSGAVLADEDLLSLLFTGGSTQAEQLVACVSEWYVPLISEMYVEICSQLNTEPIPWLVEKLKVLTINLDLTNKLLQGPSLIPLCKALNKQASLVELTFSGNFLSVECLRLMGICLHSLNSLSVLNLSYTGLQINHIQSFANAIVSTKLANPTLRHFDLSYNLLGDGSLIHIDTILRYVELETLNLADVGFTPDLFRHPHNKKIDLKINSIKELNLSNNCLESSSMEMLFAYLDPRKLKVLNISRNKRDKNVLNVIKGFLSKESTGQAVLSELNISRWDAEDSELFSLLTLVEHSLESLDLSYCSSLTGISLRRLLSNYKLKYLNLLGCENIFNYFDVSGFHLSMTSKLSLLKIYLENQTNSDELKKLSNFWEKIHGDKAEINVLPGALFLSLK